MPVLRPRSPQEPPTPTHSTRQQPKQYRKARACARVQRWCVRAGVAEGAGCFSRIWGPRAASRCTRACARA
eukprot:2818648-Pleurochrysis_carterae.AAC.1